MIMPGPIPNTKNSVEVLNDPKTIAIWEAKGWTQDQIVMDFGTRPVSPVPMGVEVETAEETQEKSLDDVLEPMGADIIEILKGAGYNTIAQLKGATQKDLVELDEIGRAKAKKIAELIKKA